MSQQFANDRASGVFQMRYISIALLAVALMGCGSGSSNRDRGELQQISFDESDEAFSPHVVSVGDGHSQVAWLRLNRDDLTYHVDVNGFAQSSGWSGSIELGSTEIDWPVHVAIAANENGQAAVLFSRGTGAGGTSIAAYWYSSSVGWSEIEAPLATGTINSLADAAMDSSGVLHILWMQEEPVPGGQGIIDLYSSSYTPGAGWSQSVLMENLPGPVIEVEIDANARGDAVAVWSQNLASGDSAIFASFSPVGQDWGTAQQISMLPEIASGPTVALDADGNAVAAWRQSDGSPSGMYMSEFDASNGWGNSLRIGSAYQSQWGADLAVDGEGAFYIVWSRRRNITQSPALTQDIVATRRQPGGVWEALTEIDDSELEATAPRVVGFETGGAMVVWRQAEIDRFEVHARRFIPDTGWPAPRVLGQMNLLRNNDASPQIAADSAGTATVVWSHETSPGGVVVYAIRFN